MHPLSQSRIRRKLTPHRGWKVLSCICFVLSVFFFPSSAELSRLERVLRVLEDRNYLSEERGVEIGADIYNEPERTSLVPAYSSGSSFDTTQINRRALSARVLYRLGTMIGTDTTEVEWRMDGELRVGHDNRDSLYLGFIRVGGGGVSAGSSGQFVAGFDTVSITTSLSGHGHWAGRSYMGRSARFPPYLGFAVTGGIRAATVREENYDPFLPLVKGTESLHRDKYQLRRQELGGTVVLEPGIGLGRRRNVTHVNAALLLERELKRCGAISFSLADRTIARVTQLLLRNDSFRLKDLESTRRFKAELDSILREDAATVRSGLTCLSPFVARNLVVQHSPPAFIGADIMLLARQRVDFDGLIEKREYPFSLPSGITVRRRGVEPSHAAMLGMWGRIGFLPTPNWSLSLEWEKRLFSSHDHVEFMREGRVDGARLTEADWSLQTAVWVGSRIRLDAGLDHMLCMVVVPREWPYRTHADIQVFIEDYVMIQLGIAWYHGGLNETRAYPLWASPLESLRTGRFIRLGAVYTF